MKFNNDDFLQPGFCKLYNFDWLEKQRIAGSVAFKSLNLLKNFVVEKTKLSLLEMDNIVENFILSNNCQPTFKGYKGFPATVCMSVNNDLVHGIPTNYILQDGDVVKFDLGVTYEGAIADTAITCIYGGAKEELHELLVKSCYEALIKGIESIEVGKQIGCIGNTIFNIGKKYNFGIITKYGGHGLSWNKPHDEPFISNKSDYFSGIRIQPGMVLAIEPLFVVGNNIETNIKSDKWTVSAQNICAHFEHSIYVHDDKVEIVTLHEN